MTVFSPSSNMPYGKNKGFSLSTIYKYQPSYIEWAIINIDDFCIDIDEFEALGNPTTISYKAGQFDLSRKKNRDFSTMNVKEITNLLTSEDGYNHSIDVKEIISEVVNKSPYVKELVDFKFPEHIRAINAYKIFLAIRE